MNSTTFLPRIANAESGHWKTDPPKDKNADAAAARRIVWWNLVRNRRTEVKALMERIAWQESVAESYQKAIDRGVASTGTPYSASVLKGKREYITTAVEERNTNRKELAALQATPIPTYREWREMVGK